MRLAKPHYDCLGLDISYLVLWIILNASDLHKIICRPPKNTKKWFFLYSIGRSTNHRFSIIKDYTVTPIESVLDSIKRHILHLFTRTAKRQGSLRGKPPVSSLK